MTGATFYVLAWIFAVQEPGGKVGEGSIFFANRLSKLECSSKAVEFAEQNPLKLANKGKGKPLYSRFVCVPVAMENRQ